MPTPVASAALPKPPPRGQAQSSALVPTTPVAPAPLPTWAKVVGLGLLGLWLYARVTGKKMSSLFERPARRLPEVHVMADLDFDGTSLERTLKAQAKLRLAREKVDRAKTGYRYDRSSSSAERLRLAREELDRAEAAYDADIAEEEENA